MDEGIAGKSNPASVAGSVKPIAGNNQAKLFVPESHPHVSLPSRDADYRVADLFGRCFLRVCYWVDRFSSMTRRGEALPYVPFPHRRVNSLATPAQEMLTADSTDPLSGTPPVATA